MTKPTQTKGPSRLAETVRKAQAGDSAALGELISSHLDMLYSVTGRALKGHADVDDVVQNIVIGVMKNVSSVREPERVSGWILAIARNEIADHLRGWRIAAERNQVLDVAAPQPDPGSDFTNMMILRLGLSSQRRQVVQASDWLDPDARFVLSLWWLELLGEISRADLSTALGTNSAHAAVRIKRMREQLELCRRIVTARQARPACDGLCAVLEGWDGVPSPVWRKRLARHLQDCQTCTHHQILQVPPERLLVGVAMLPAVHLMSISPSLQAILSGAAAAGSSTGGLVAGTAAAGTSAPAASSVGSWLGASAFGKLVAGVSAVALVTSGAVIVTQHDPSGPARTGRPQTGPSVSGAPSSSATTPADRPPAFTTPPPVSTVAPVRPTPRPPSPGYGTTVETADAAPPANVRPQRLPVRPEKTLVVSASGDNDPRADVSSLIHRGEWVTYHGRGYIRVETAMAFTQRVGAVTMPSWTGLQGKLFHVASGRGYRLDDQMPGRPEGCTWMGDPEHGLAVLPSGAQQMWGWEYYYLDGEVTFNSNERGADYNLYVHIVDRRTIDADLQTAPDETNGRVRYGLNRDVGTDATAVPQYLTRRRPPDPATVWQNSQVRSASSQ